MAAIFFSPDGAEIIGKGCSAVLRNELDSEGDGSGTAEIGSYPDLIERGIGVIGAAGAAPDAKLGLSADSYKDAAA